MINNGETIGLDKGPRFKSTDSELGSGSQRGCLSDSWLPTTRQASSNRQNQQTPASHGFPGEFAWLAAIRVRCTSVFSGLHPSSEVVLVHSALAATSALFPSHRIPCSPAQSRANERLHTYQMDGMNLRDQSARPPALTVEPLASERKLMEGGFLDFFSLPANLQKREGRANANGRKARRAFFLSFRVTDACISFLGPRLDEFSAPVGQIERAIGQCRPHGVLAPTARNPRVVKRRVCAGKSPVQRYGHRMRKLFTVKSHLKASPQVSVDICPPAFKSKKQG